MSCDAPTVWGDYLSRKEKGLAKSNKGSLGQKNFKASVKPVPKTANTRLISNFALSTAGDISSFFASGDLEIDWVIQSPAFNSAQVKIKLQNTEVANHYFSSGNYQWAPSEIQFSTDTLNFSMQFLPASRGANGELILVSLLLTSTSGGSTLTYKNFSLQGWDYSGGPQLA
jgi:hypothetical protein